MHDALSATVLPSPRSVLDELRTLWQDKLTKKGLIREESMQAGFLARGGGPLPQLGQIPGVPPALNTPAG